jgi:hypothetical protein
MKRSPNPSWELRRIRRWFAANLRVPNDANTWNALANNEGVLGDLRPSRKLQKPAPEVEIALAP